MRTTAVRRWGQQPVTVATDPYLVFTVHGERYAMPLLSVRELMDLDRIEPAAGEADALRGTQVLRGRRLPVLDLGVVLERTPLRPTRTSCTLLAETEPGGNEPVPLVGFAVDGVVGVAAVDPAALVPAPRLGDADGADLVVALAPTAQGPAPVLDPARVLASADARQALAAWLTADADVPPPMA